MGILELLHLGPSKSKVWSQVASEIGGDFIDRGFWHADNLVYKHGQWRILLDTFQFKPMTANQGFTPGFTLTRMRSPFVSKDGLSFSIDRSINFRKLGKLIGYPGIGKVDTSLDTNFVIKGNDDNKIKILLQSERINELINLQPKITFEIRDNDKAKDADFPDGVDFPEGVDQLYFQCFGVIKDKMRLKSLFELFSITLDELVRIGSASPDDPGIIVE